MFCIMQRVGEEENNESQIILIILINIKIYSIQNLLYCFSCKSAWSNMKYTIKLMFCCKENTDKVKFYKLKIL